MKKYILIRAIRSFISLLIVTIIAFAMVYTLIPRQGVFKSDLNYTKIVGTDNLKVYTSNVYEKLGYISFMEQKEFCALLRDDETLDYTKCMTTGNAEILEEAKKYQSKGYKLGTLESGIIYLEKEIPIITRVGDWLINLFKFDHPWRVQDDNNQDIERKYYLGKSSNGLPALACSGCEYKYQLYMNSSFPFIHTNAIKIDLGISYPTFAYQNVVDVIMNSQGEAVKKDMVYPNGTAGNAAINLESCKYKYTLDTLDYNKFNDSYADCYQVKADMSMMGTSAFLGIISIILTYLFAVPFGIAMASNKGKLIDKVGMAYIIMIIAIPSLAYIYAFKFIGNVYFGLPDKFPMMGAQNWKSYVLPVISLTLPGVSSVMMWIRRYMIDQTTADYVKFARAKGLSQSEIFNKHILRNAIIPIVHGIPGSIVAVIMGALITETVYAVPGMGKMLPGAITAYNNPMIIALTFIFTGVSIFALLAGDILITYIDPRISLSDDGGRK